MGKCTRTINSKTLGMYALATKIKKNGQSYQNVYDDLYKVNSGLKSRHEKTKRTKDYRKSKGELYTGLKVTLPSKYCSTKKMVKNNVRNNPTTQVCRNSKGKIVACKKCVPAPWMKIVMKENGVAEVPGIKKNNPRILEYHKASKYWVASEHGIHSWCGSFVAWIMIKYKKTPVNEAYKAARWRGFGKNSKPVYGAIGIKSRNGGNHVSFLVGRSKDNKYYYMIGGNQGTPGKVYIKEYPRRVWDTFRVPKDYDASNCILPIYTGKISGGGGH